jgi:hypothetical protein
MRVTPAGTVHVCAAPVVYEKSATVDPPERKLNVPESLAVINAVPVAEEVSVADAVPESVADTVTNVATDSVIDLVPASTTGIVLNPVDTSVADFVPESTAVRITRVVLDSVTDLVPESLPVFGVLDAPASKSSTSINPSRGGINRSAIPFSPVVSNEMGT